MNLLDRLAARLRKNQGLGNRSLGWVRAGFEKGGIEVKYSRSRCGVQYHRYRVTGVLVWPAELGPARRVMGGYAKHTGIAHSA